jgi:hypothetical protein
VTILLLVSHFAAIYVLLHSLPSVLQTILDIEAHTRLRIGRKVLTSLVLALSIARFIVEIYVTLSQEVAVDDQRAAKQRVSVVYSAVYLVAAVVAGIAVAELSRKAKEVDRRTAKSGAWLWAVVVGLPGFAGLAIAYLALDMVEDGNVRVVPRWALRYASRMFYVWFLGAIVGAAKSLMGWSNVEGAETA